MLVNKLIFKSSCAGDVGATVEQGFFKQLDPLLLYARSGDQCTLFLFTFLVCCTRFGCKPLANRTSYDTLLKYLCGKAAVNCDDIKNDLTDFLNFDANVYAYDDDPEENQPYVF